MNEFIASALGALLGAFATHLLERSKLKKAQASEREEKKAREAVETKLADIQRRANAPFFIDYQEGFNALYARNKGDVYSVSPSKGNVICWMREKVNEAIPEGETVYHVLKNSGTDCRWITAELDGEAVKLAQEADMKGALGLIYLAYPFKTSNFGKVQKLRIEFESETGFPGCHIYLVKHGHRGIVRFDPPTKA